MAVIIQYIVERNGVQKMTFTDKKEADAYDKMLDIADAFYELLETAPVDLADQQLEDLSLHLAKHTDALAGVLKGAKSKPKKKVISENKTDNNTEDEQEINVALETTINATDMPSSQNAA